MIMETTFLLSFPINYFYNKNVTNAFFAPLETKTLENFLTSLYKLE